MKKNLANRVVSLISHKKKKKMKEQFMKSMSMFMYKISKVLQRAVLEKENNT